MAEKPTYDTLEKRIRDEHGKWWPLDAYVAQKTDSEITHTICPDCREIYYG